MAKFTPSEFLLKSNYPQFDLTYQQEPSDIFIDFSPLISENDLMTLVNVSRLVSKGMKLKNHRFELTIGACIVNYLLKSEKDEVDFDEIIDLACKSYDYLLKNKKDFPFVFEPETQGGQENLHLTLINMDKIGQKFFMDDNM